MGQPKAPYGSSSYCTVHTVGTDGTFGASVFTLDKIVSTNIPTHPRQGTFQMEFDHKVNNEAYDTFIDTYLSETPVDAQEQIYEDGSKDIISAGGEAATLLGFVYYEAPLDSKRGVWLSTGYLSGNTGAASYSQGALSVTPMQVTGKPFGDSGDTVTVPLAVIDATKVDTSGLTTPTFTGDKVGDKIYGDLP